MRIHITGADTAVAVDLRTYIRRDEHLHLSDSHPELTITCLPRRAPQRTEDDQEHLCVSIGHAPIMGAIVAALVREFRSVLVNAWPADDQLVVSIVDDDAAARRAALAIYDAILRFEGIRTTATGWRRWFPARRTHP